MEELRAKLEQGILTMWDVGNAYDAGRITHEDAEILAGILMDC